MKGKKMNDFGSQGYKDFLEKHREGLTQNWANILNMNALPYIVQFHLTRYCPFGCDYCAFNCGPWDSKQILPAQDIKHWIDTFRRLPNTRNIIGISGGEPMSTPLDYQREVFQYALGDDHHTQSDLWIFTNGFWLNNDRLRNDTFDMLASMRNVYPVMDKDDGGWLRRRTTLRIEFSFDDKKKDLEMYFKGIRLASKDEILKNSLSFILGGSSKAKFWQKVKKLRKEYGIEKLSDDYISTCGYDIWVDRRMGVYWDNTGNPESKISPKNQLVPQHLFNNEFITKWKNICVYFYQDRTASLRVGNTIVAQTPYINPDGSYKTWPTLKAEFVQGLFDDALYFQERKAARWEHFKSTQRVR